MDEENNGNGNGNGTRSGDQVPEQPAAPAPGGPVPQQGWQPQPSMPPQSYQGPPQGYQYPPPKRKKAKSNKPQVVGALLAVVAVLGLVSASMIFLGWTFFGNIEEMAGSDSGTATIQGRATFLNGTGVQGVEILIIGEALSTVTDEDGYFILYNVPTGDQRLQASMDGYITIVRKLTVNEDITFGPNWDGTDGLNTEVRFTMSPGTGTIETGRWTSDDLEMVKDFLIICGSIGIIASLITAMGAYHAFKRTNLSMVVVGAVAGIFTFGFFIGSVLAFIALFILLISLDEFRAKDDDEED